MPARQHRVTRGDDYRRVVRTGNRVGGAFCITYAVSRSSEAPTDEAISTESHDRDSAARFGYIVSKSVGNAVVRNRVRRRMKSVTEDLIHNGITGIDIVFRALPAAADASFSELQREMRKSVSRLSKPRNRVVGGNDAPAS